MRNIFDAARAALDRHLVDGTGDDAIGAPRGYPAQRVGDATLDPSVQVSRAGDVIAFASVRGEDGAVEPPWVSVEARVCSSLVVEADPDDTTTTTPTTTAAGGRTAPA
jgi:hypothetical protein